jgi:hypothetical protein
MTTALFANLTGAIAIVALLTAICRAAFLAAAA